MDRKIQVKVGVACRPRLSALRIDADRDCHRVRTVCVHGIVARI